MNNFSSLSVFLQHCQKRIDGVLREHLPSDGMLPQTLHKAMHYSTLNGGKRLRPTLVYAAGKALSIDPQILDKPACAVELIHAYSLVHDDLPAMDNDSLRRGKPTTHIHFNESTAILAGDALQTLAFHILSQPQTGVTSKQTLKMIEALATASGSFGMAGGQAIDLESTGKTLTLPELENMHIHKTGALIRASVKLATLASSEVHPEAAKKLDHYAKCLGLAFQVQDDILDEESDTAILGKTGGKDRANNKPTYPSLLGMKAAKEKARSLHDEALHSLESLGEDADMLRELSNYVISRIN